MKINLLLLIAFLPFYSCLAQDQTVWRNGTDGIYQESGLLDSWPESGPEILWYSEELGQGHSSPVVAGSYIYTAGMLDGEGYIFKFSLDGKLVYKHAYGPEFTESFYGTRGTPVIAEDKIYMVSGLGMLMCIDEANGDKLWEVDMVKDLGGQVIKWGYNETPVIDGELIFCTPGGKNNVVALNRNTGKMIWSSGGKGELSAYCTPLLLTHNGRKILATHTESFLIAIDVKTGKLLWSHPQPNRWSVHPNTPIYHDGKLFYFSGYGQGGGLLKLNQDGTAVEQLWKTTMDSRMGGAVLIDGYIYASGDVNRPWRAINWESGEDAYSSEELGKGVTIAADGKLFCYSDRGELGLVNATPSSFELKSKTRVTLGSEQHWAHPMIHNGVLYLRHGKALIAYKVK